MNKEEERKIYNQIKNQNGERFAQAIRAFHNGIFEIPGFVDFLKYAGRTPTEELLEYLASFLRFKEEMDTDKDIFQLCDQAGYDAYVVTALTDEDNPNFDPNDPKTWVGQNTLKRYYAPGEGLCTFCDPERYKRYYILALVGKDVDKIQRKDFKGKEEREDPYGTSVMMIQIAKTGGYISIKNRYNHTVDNPDNTYKSNPDNIIPGLSSALCQYFNVDFFSRKIPLPDGFVQVRDQEGKDRLIRYHTEKEGYYFGPSYYVKDGVITKVAGHEILLEHFVLNLKDGTVKDVTGTNDALQELFEKMLTGKKIQITKDKDGVQHFFANDQKVLTVCDGRLVSVNLPKGITKIGDKAFYRCPALTSIDIPDGLTEIGWSAFYRCSSLASIDIPESVTKIEWGAFLGCSSLTSLHIPEGVSEMSESAFEDCSSLTSFHIPDRVTKIGCRAFQGCSSLTSLHIPDGVTKIEPWAFRCCSSLISVHIPDGLTEIGHSVFEGCSALTSIHIPDGVTKINETAFRGCSSLTSVHIPDGVKEIDYLAFEGCSSLTSVHIPDSVIKMESAFYGCSSLTSVHISEGLREIGSSAFNQCSALTSIHIPERVRKIGKYAFEGCSALASLHIPEGVREIENNAFKGCKKLTLTCSDESQVQMIKASGFEGPIKIVPQALSQQVSVIYTYSSSEESASSQFKGNVPQRVAPKMEQRPKTIQCPKKFPYPHTQLDR